MSITPTEQQIEAEAKTAERLIAIMTDGRLDNVTGKLRLAECWCSDSNGGVDIADIFAAFEANYTLSPKAK